MTPYGDTCARLRELALTQPVALVMYSGGKDSLVLADLAAQHFAKIVLVHLYLIPGLAYMDASLAWAKARWPNADAYQAPKPQLFDCLHYGVYCFRQKDLRPAKNLGEPGSKGLKPFSHPELRALIRHDLGVNLILNGGKRADSVILRRKIKANQDRDFHYPIHAWNKADVKAYLMGQGIPFPEQPDNNLSDFTLTWIHDNHPEDWQRLCEVFPFAPALIKRREWYGLDVRRKNR